MDRGAHGHGFIGVYIVNERDGRKLRDHFAHHRHPGHAADEQHLVDVAPFHLRFLQNHLANRFAFLDEMPRLQLELFPGQLDFYALAIVAVHNRRARPARELNLGRERAALEILVALQIQKRILAVRAIEFFRHVIHDHVIPIFAAEPVIAIRREHLDALALNTHDRDVEGATAEIENENGLVFVQFVETIGNRCGCGLVDDLQNIEPGELAGRDRSGALSVVKISGHSDDRVRDRLLQIFFSVRLQLAEDERRQFLGRINLAVELAMELLLRLAHLPLHEIDDPLGFGHRIIFRQGADDHALAIEKNDRRRDAFAFGIRDDLRLAVNVNVRHRAERGAKIDSDSFSSSHFVRVDWS